MTGMTEAMPRSPEAWKSMGCCVDFPQPWADLMWGAGVRGHASLGPRVPAGGRIGMRA